MDDRALERAGLDYWPEVQLTRHLNLDALYESLPDARFVYLTTKADRIYTDWEFHQTIASFLDGKHAVCPKTSSARTGKTASASPFSTPTFAA